MSNTPLPVWLVYIKKSLFSIGLAHLWLDPEKISSPDLRLFKETYWLNYFTKIHLSQTHNSLTDKFLSFKPLPVLNFFMT